MLRAVFDDLLESNRSYVAGFSLQGLAPQAAKGLCLITCMDTRIEPLPMLGLRPGDAKILRNAGGRVMPEVLRSVVLAVAFLEVTRVAVMHHTDCAMTKLDDDAVRAQLGPQQADAVAGWDFLTVADPDQALAADVEAVRRCRALPEGIGVEGWRYDVATGEVNRVVALRRTGPAGG